MNVAVFKERVNSNERLRPLLVFLVKLIIIFVGWRLFSILIGQQSEPNDQLAWPWLTEQWRAFNDRFMYVLTALSRQVILLLGYDLVTVDYNFIKIQGYSGVVVGHYCLALELMVLYIALIVSYPQRVWKKIRYVAVGLLAIQAINILRIVGLLLLTVYAPDYVDFNHHFTFRVVVFAFILWMYFRYIREKKPREERL